MNLRILGVTGAAAAGLAGVALWIADRERDPLTAPSAGQLASDVPALRADAPHAPRRVGDRREVDPSPAAVERLVESMGQAAERRSSPSTGLSQADVQSALDEQLVELEHADGAVVSIECTPPRCLAQIQGPQLSTATPKEIAERLSLELGDDIEWAATLRSHLPENADDFLHLTAMSFFPAGGSREEAEADVKAAVERFKADLDAD